MEGVSSDVDLVIEKKQKEFLLKKTVFTLSYISLLPVFIVFIVLVSLTFKYQGDGFVNRQLHKPQFQAVPEDLSNSSVAIELHDGRVDALDEFFASYNSPLEGYAKIIVDEADKHNIDYRLLPAIAMQESTLCKKIIKDSYNCWGFGIYANKVTKFSDYDSAIKTVTSTLSEKYIQLGYESPQEIMTKYTPSSEGKWADVVSLIMTRLENSL